MSLELSQWIIHWVSPLLLILAAVWVLREVNFAGATSK